jgi:hypothetical protein
MKGFMTPQIRLPIRSLLEFYDDPDKAARGHVTAITSIVGEDLGAGLLIDYYFRQGLEVKVLNGNVTQGTNKGNRLDRWVVVTRGKRLIYYQVEIKNWGAHAIGGRRLAVNASASVLRKHKIERWSKEWGGNGFIKEGVQKVLTPMSPPEEGALVEPLVCFWDAMHPTGAATPLFSVPLHSRPFARVWVFSMSSYLRNLLKSGEQFVEIDAPAIKARLRFLKELVG